MLPLYIFAICYVDGRWRGGRTYRMLCRGRCFIRFCVWGPATASPALRCTAAHMHASVATRAPRFERVHALRALSKHH